jgi:hypothetical protein
MGLNRVLSRRNWVSRRRWRSLSVPTRARLIGYHEIDEPEPPPADVQIDVLGVAARGEWHSTDDTRLLPLLRV